MNLSDQYSPGELRPRCCGKKFVQHAYMLHVLSLSDRPTNKRRSLLHFRSLLIVSDLAWFQERRAILSSIVRWAGAERPPAWSLLA